MQLLSRSVGPVGTNVHVLADERSREAIAIDTATPCLAWLTGLLEERGWRLRLIVSTHGHWDHIGDNAAVQAWSREQAAHLEAHAGAPVPGPAAASALEPDAAGEQGAPIAVHSLDADRLTHPDPLFAPFEIVPSYPAVELAEGDRLRFGEIDLEILHTPGHTEGSVCLFDPVAGLLLAGDTLFASGWGRTDLPGGSEAQIADSLARLAELEDRVRVLPGHGPATTIGRERPWLDVVRRTRRLPF